MLLPIETWLANSHLPTESTIALKESIICYKAGADRAAMLFGYLSWNLILRDRLLSSSCPTGIPPGQWQSMNADLRNEDKWDAQTFDCTQSRGAKAIFDLSDDLRDQVKYWKNRRNDCAHFKNNPIASSHVEAFWQFMQANITRFAVIGSSDELITRLEHHYDPNYTPPNTDVNHLIQLIPSAIDSSKLPAFFNDLYQKFVGSSGNLTGKNRRDLANLFSSVLSLHNSIVSTECVKFLNTNEKLLMRVLKANPSHVYYWSSDSNFIRRLWRELSLAYPAYFLDIFASLLRNGMIPVDQIQESIDWLVQKWPSDAPNEQDIVILEQYGFFDKYEVKAFQVGGINDFDWANSNKDMICYLIERKPLSTTVVEAICVAFADKYHPYELRDHLRSLFAENQAKRDEFESIAQSIPRDIPSRIFS